MSPLIRSASGHSLLFCSMLLTPYSPHQASNPFLGVVSDLSRFMEGEAWLRPKPARVAKLVAAIDGYLEHRTFAGGDPRSFLGKLEYTAGSAGYCRIGRAALATLRAWVHACLQCQYRVGWIFRAKHYAKDSAWVAKCM